MVSDYKKFTIEMHLQTDKYRLWKHGMDRAVCVLETYKEKRSVYLTVSNVLPSAALAEDRKEYHLVLLGVDQGSLVHRDFGPVHIDQSGTGAFFQKFGGPALSCYTHCIFAAADQRDGQTETILSGETPFYLPDPKQPGETAQAKILWKDVFAQCEEAGRRGLFSPEIDETGADWWRVESTSALPQPLLSCAGLIHSRGHYVVGQNGRRRFVGVPGRFLLAEQPLREEKVFRLWQPMRGGEAFFDGLENLSGALAESLFGYWIAEIDERSGMLRPL